MNSYFASVEQQANPFLRGKPIGITGKNQERSVIATASIEAKALGVKTAMSTWEAKKICPSIILWPGDPEKYTDIMDRFNAIYTSFTPSVQSFSIDESFLDLTQEAEDYFGAICIAQTIRTRLREELGERITASIGIAPNKLMAKLAGERVKPNGLTVARPEDVIDLLNQSNLDDLCGIGPRIHERLRALGIETFQQLREFPLDGLIYEFKRYGTWLHEASWGRDLDEEDFSNSDDNASHGDIPKSYGHSYTLPQNTKDPRVLKRYLLGLADKVAWRMRRDGVSAHRVRAVVRFGDFHTHSQQTTSKEPITDGLNLFQIAWKILEPCLTDDVRLIGVSASSISSDSQQPSLFKKERNMTSVLCALDAIQHRYGSDSWKRGSTLPIEFKTRSSGFHPKSEF